MKLKLTPKLQEKIGNNIKLGMPLKFAAQAAGISEATFYRWLDCGEKATKGVYYEFREYIKECESVAVQLHLKLITKAANDGSWQASAWILERRHPEDFGRKDRLDMQAGINAKVEHPGGVCIYLPDNGRDPDLKQSLKPAAGAGNKKEENR